MGHYSGEGTDTRVLPARAVSLILQRIKLAATVVAIGNEGILEKGETLTSGEGFSHPLRLLSRLVPGSTSFPSGGSNPCLRSFPCDRKSIADARKKCKLFDWIGKDEIVAQGRWLSDDPKRLVNGIPLGPNTAMVWVDVPTVREAFLWRPTTERAYIEDVVNSAIAWPADKVALDKISEIQEVEDASSHLSVTTKLKKKWKLFDVGESGTDSS